MLWIALEDVSAWVIHAEDRCHECEGGLIDCEAESKRLKDYVVSSRSSYLSKWSASEARNVQLAIASTPVVSERR